MKIQSDLFAAMESSVKAVVEHGGGVPKLRDWMQSSGLSVTAAMWRLWSIALHDLQYDDSHPSYTQRQRIVPHRPGFNIYSSGINDDHIATALRRIMRSMGFTA